MTHRSQRNAVVPSMLVFGPQAEFPSDEILAGLREELTQNPCLSPLRKALAEITEFWDTLIAFDNSLKNVAGKACLIDLQQWIENGGSLPSQSETTPNLFAFSATVIFQIAQYVRYLTSLGGSNPHAAVLKAVQTGGVHGFCVGLLSAIAVSSAEDAAELGSRAATIFRWAICIGAYVDCNGYSPEQPSPSSCISVRWRDDKTDGRQVVDHILDEYAGAYVSSVTDEACVTITANATHMAALTATLQAQDLRVKTIHVRGRFHSTAAYTATSEKLLEFSQQSNGLELLSAEQLRAIVRSPADSGNVVEGALSRLLMENTLTKVADWYSTMKLAIAQMSDGHKTVMIAGFGSAIPPSLVQASNLKLLSLNTTDWAEPSFSPGPNYPPHSIAIVGMAGRFPGADSLDELWDLLAAGNVMVERAPTDRLNLPSTGDYANKKWWGNFLKDSDAFDHKFFKKSSREALAWDPQQRVLLEVLYEALESSGYFRATSDLQPEDYGCYIGAVMNNYYDNVSCHPPTAYATTGTSRCYLSGVMSHYFGWTGPSLTIDTACSSSLVAINTACRAIWSGECSRAIAGGTNIITSPFDYQNLEAAGFLSPNGQCKPFDAGADGYCRGEAVAVIVLKPFADALKENDNIMGVIMGSAANQNQNFSHITVPHSESQSKLYRQVMKLADLKPNDVSYVEAHGTGTGVGDPVECRSIREAFGGPQRDDTLHFSSIKGNIGHTEATAGIAGLLKVLLMMQHGQIPPQASHNSLNPKIPALGPDKMAIPRSITPWESRFRIACVNSYGAAGSNSALIVAQKPPTASISKAVGMLSKHPVFISAASSNSLNMYREKLLDWLRGCRSRATVDISVSDVAFNLADKANHLLPHILTASVSNLEDLEQKLATGAAQNSITLASTPKPVVMVFAGQESEFVGLSEDAYRSSTVFRSYLDQCDEILLSLGLESLYPSIFQQTPISNLVTLHSALFAVQYASAKAWLDCGLAVNAVVGHSFGQLTAFCISGTLSLPDTLKLITGRAEIILNHWGPEPGSMLFLQADQETVIGVLQTMKAQGRALDAEVACYNGPKSHVIVGSAEAIDDLETFVSTSSASQNPIFPKRLRVRNGYHSALTEPLLEHLNTLAKSLQWNSPSIHLETCDDGQTVANPDYTIIAKHARSPVFFQQAVERLTQRFSQSAWIEAGRGSSVIQLVKGSVTTASEHVFWSPQLTSSKAQSSLMDVTIEMWKAGYKVQYWPFHRSQMLEYQVLRLPSYQFEKTRHWLPFTGRSAEQDKTVESIQEIAPENELLTFLRFKDDRKTQALFRISPLSDRFKAMLGGHVMSGQSLAPASLYFEVAARAALSLYPEAEKGDFVPTVQDLVMLSPIGLDTNKDIILTLRQSDASNNSWAFSITTQALPNAAGQTSAPFEQSTGIVHLLKRDDAQSAQDFRRFESLTGYRRYKEIMNHQEAEMMSGKHIYRAFNHIVHYGEEFRGIKQVACVKFEAAGKVIITPNINDPADQRLCDTPMTDSFMQFAGFLVNYFNNPSLEDLFVCHKIEHIQIGGMFNPDAKEWIVYSTMSEDENGHASSDAYVFEAESKKMVMAAFGFRFSKMSQSLLARLLKGVNKPSATNEIREPITGGLADESLSKATKPKVAATERSASKRLEFYQILHNVTDVSVDDLSSEVTLEDLGVDSLGATEVLNDIRTALGLTIDLSSFLFFPNIGAIVAHIDEKLGIGDNDDDASTVGSTSDDASSTYSGASSISTYPPSRDEKEDLGITTPKSIPEPEPVSRPSIASAYDAFQEIKFGYDRLAVGTKAANFWSEAYPDQARLVRAYILEAFTKLGCDLGKLQPSQHVPDVQEFCLARHKQLVHQLYLALEDGGLIKAQGNGFIRTRATIDATSAETIYATMIGQYPQHDVVNELTKIVGERFAECLKGEEDGLQIVFGSRKNKQLLEDMYKNWPLLRTPTLLLGDFLTKACNASTGGGKFRILEIGAGTGGTTRYIVDHLQNHGIAFEYVFTDISSSLVAAAKKQFKDVEGMSFEVLDVEQPPAEYLGAFHYIVSTNCIHATRNLDLSLSRCRDMLRNDGTLTLIEITKNMFWLDIVVGLFEGWWYFEDDRSHALVNEKHWERKMRGAGFKEVSWTQGNMPEAGTVRVIAGFASASTMVKKPPKANVQTLVYKKVDGQDIQADVYCPTNVDTSTGKLPIALMIHGGSHIIFSRKDVRPAQTRLLLERGYLPVSLDHRLCPEVKLGEGPMVDVRDALKWARSELPRILLERFGLNVDGERVVVVGWSSGGQLAMSLAWTSPQIGLKPPEAILSFYCPTNYEDEWWRTPIQPLGAEDRGDEYDVLEGIQDQPITNYGVVGAWEPLSDPRIRTDPRCRIVLHINWKAQTLPIIIGGLLSKNNASKTSIKDWNALPQPSLEEIIPVSPRAQITRGNYQTPTFMIHGTKDDLIPWEQSQGTYKALRDHGVTAGLALVDGAPHICDLSTDPQSDGWKAVLKGYDFLDSYVLR